MNKKGIHVISRRQGGWAVRSAGAAKATKVYTNQEEAVQFARESAKKEQSVLYIHRKDGTVKDRQCYGIDPFPPRH